MPGICRIIDKILLHLFIYLFIYLWLCWVFVSVRGLSLVVASGGHSSSRCAGLSLSRPLLLRSTGSRRAGSAIVPHGPSCSAACGIFPDQGLNPCPLHWQADSQPLSHQESPPTTFLTLCITSALRGLWLGNFQDVPAVKICKPLAESINKSTIRIPRFKTFLHPIPFPSSTSPKITLRFFKRNIIIS